MALGAVAAAAQVQAQLPAARLFVVSPPGGKAGTSFEVTISGPDLDEASALFFSQPGVTAVAKTAEPSPIDAILGRGPQPVPGRFVVTIAADAPVGLCDVRAASRFGVSNPRAFAVGHLDELNETEPNNAPAQASAARLEAVLNGAIGGGADVDCFKLPVKAGQRVLVECLAHRIDSRLDATLVLLDAAGGEVARSRDDVRRDPLLDFTAPADAEYVVKVHDVTFAGSGEHFYRLIFTAGPHVDYVLPPAGAPGAKTKLTLYGRNLPGGQPAAGVEIGGKPLVALPVEVDFPGDPPASSLAAAVLVEPPESGLDGFAYRHPGIPEPVGLGIATAPVVLEAEPNSEPAQAQVVQAPCEVAGQFYPKADQDWLRFEAKKGDVFWIEVFAHRLGEPVDPFLLVQHVTKNEKGEESAQDLHASDDLGANAGGAAFDTGTDDPAQRYVAPSDGACRIQVRDLYSTTAADPRNVYRISIRREAPDLRLVAIPRFQGANADPNQNPPQVWNPFLRRGGTELIDVLALRRDGFSGEVRVSIEGLPKGVTCAGAVIGAGLSSATLVLSAADDAPAWVGAVRIAGTASIGGADVTRAARPASMVWPGADNQFGPRSRVAREVVLAVSGVESAPYVVEAAGGAAVEMCKAGALKVPVKVTRRGDFKGPVALAAIGAPPGTQPKPLALDGNTAEGSFELAIQEGAPLGTFTFYLQATSQVPYSRNPEAAARAAERKAEIDKLLADLQTKAKPAGDAKAEADKAAEQAAQAAKKAADAQAKAAAEVKPVADEVKAAADEVKRIVDGIKAAADKAFQEADGRAKAATEAQAAAAKLSTDAANAAKPQNLNAGAGSTPVTLKITPAPITLSAAAPAGPLKQGAKLEVAVTIARLYGYAEAVQVAAAFPGGVSGLNAPAVTIPQGQTSVPLVIEAAAGATLGTHAVTLTATAKLNNANLQATTTFPLTVEKP
ncbi:MAG: pre-peptidase C-terminal domain-containing protein [Planctomycetes bacterium]|nr:pre-peptidase C-terminal domain-containing protein [Planctomycetota bacterium]